MGGDSIMAKFKIEGRVIEILSQEAINGGEYYCTPFVIETTDEHPAFWLFKSYGDTGNTASRLRVDDKVEVEFTSRDKKTNKGIWHSNKIALMIKILEDATRKNWNY
jgi:hypothetical protein